jgi:hypothetical protein
MPVCIKQLAGLGQVHFFPVIYIYAHLIIAILLHVNFQHVKGTVQRDGPGRKWAHSIGRH